MAQNKLVAKQSQDPDVLRGLASDPDIATRLALAKNNSTPIDVLMELANAYELVVQEAARKRLSMTQRAEADALRAAREQEEGAAGGSRPGSAVLKAPTMLMSTLSTIPGKTITASMGLVYATSSRIAWSGLNTQASRLENAMNAALLALQFEAEGRRANAVIGVSVAVNSSQGASAALMGSSEGILVVGTAVVLTEGEAAAS
jgi:uncharacterized protein YbjQ (UPF0145 family)